MKGAGPAKPDHGPTHPDISSMGIAGGVDRAPVGRVRGRAPSQSKASVARDGLLTPGRRAAPNPLNDHRRGVR